MSNCLLFVVVRWWRLGGFVIIRKSQHGWWPHFLWSPDLITFEEFQPAIPNHHLKFPPPLYRGIVKTHQPKETACTSTLNRQAGCSTESIIP